MSAIPSAAERASWPADDYRHSITDDAWQRIADRKASRETLSRLLPIAIADPQSITDEVFCSMHPHDRKLLVEHMETFAADMRKGVRR